MTSDRYDEDEGARPSSLRAVHKLAAPDIHYERQLRRDVEITNERVRKDLGPPGAVTSPLGFEIADSTKHQSTENAIVHDLDEDETMKAKHVVLATALGVAAGCTSGGNSRDGETASTSVGSHTAALRTPVDRRYVAPEVKDGKLIMPFYEHVFGSRCFDTLECSVLYEGRYDTKEDEKQGPLTDSLRRNLRANWSIGTLPTVASVKWVSKDGTRHEQDIDLGKIFASRLVHYAPELDVSEVNLSVISSPPEIVLAVDDRSIRVYMNARISLLHARFPGRPLSNFQNDVVLVHTERF